MELKLVVYRWGDYMSGIIVYTTKICPNCKTLKQILKESGIVFAETDMTTPAALTELAMNNVFTMSAPVLQVQDNFYTVDDIMDGDSVDRQKVESLVNL